MVRLRIIREDVLEAVVQVGGHRVQLWLYAVTYPELNGSGTVVLDPRRMCSTFMEAMFAWSKMASDWRARIQSAEQSLLMLSPLLVDNTTDSK